MEKVELAAISTLPPKKIKEDDARRDTEKFVKRISALQHALYAEKKQALLVVLQGMDGSGKDSAVKNVFGSCSPIGVTTYSFKKPTDEEFAHDFLWRVHQVCPRKGMIQIFIRSHYEDILIQRVHKWIDEERVQKRMGAINHFEKLLQFDNNTVILKFYLHISHDHQRKELQERIDDPVKQWKHNPADWKESELWDEYMRCYQDALNESAIQWHIIPVDKRWYRDYLVSDTVCKTLEKMNPKFPVLTEK